jgi:hypothetical protein
MEDTNWEIWPLGVDAVGNPIPEPELLGRLIGSHIVEWLVQDGGGVYVRRLQD